MAKVAGSKAVKGTSGRRQNGHPATAPVGTIEGVKVGVLQQFCAVAPNGSRWTLLEGAAQTALPLLPAESINCIVTSPPYYCQRDYGVEGQIGHEPTIRGYVSEIVDCFRQIKRILKPDGVVFLNLGDTFYSAKGKPHGNDAKSNGRSWSRKKLRAVDGPGLGLPRKSLIGIPWRVALAMQEDGWTLRSDVLWKRPGALPEPTAHDRPRLTHEHVFIFSKGPHYYFDRTAIVGEEDLWHIAPRSDTPGAHFAPFPSALVEKCLKCGCPPGGSVLDPFVGSGTTMAVALRMNRNVTGIELHPGYVQFIVKRLMSLDESSATTLPFQSAAR